jgi:hypothetical protein
MSAKRLLPAGLTAVALLLVILIFTDWSPILRGPAPDTAVWHWPYLLRPVARWWPALLTAGALLALAFFWLRRPPHAPDRWPLALLIPLSLALQLSLIYADRPAVLAELVDRTLAVQTNGYFWTAAQADHFPALLADYPAAMGQFESEHARTHPPGLPLLNWWVIRLMARWPDAAEWLAAAVWPQRCVDLWLLNQPAHIVAALGIMAFVPVIAANVAILLVYLLARRLFAPPGVRLATLLTAVMPALLIFAPLPDQLFVPLSLGVLLAFLAGFAQQNSARLIYFFIAGLLLSVSSFLSLGNAALLLPLLLFVALTISAGRNAPAQTVSLSVLASLREIILPFGLGAAAVWLVYWLGWGVPPWAILQTSLAEHYALATSQRSYGHFFVYNLVDLILFAGVTAVAGLALGLLDKRANLTARQLAASLAVFILLLNLSGSTRGEVGRIWLFFTPLVALLGGGFLGDWLEHGTQINADKRRFFASSVGATICFATQLGMAVAIGLSWQPVEAVIVRAERPLPLPPLAQLTPLHVPFDGPIVLEGYAVNQTVDSLEISYQWRAMGATLRPYAVFNHLLDESGQLVAQADGWPVNGQWPPTCWRSGDLIVDPYRLDLAGLPPGQYRLVMGLYDAATDQRLGTSVGETAVEIVQIERSDQ